MDQLEERNMYVIRMYSVNDRVEQKGSRTILYRAVAKSRTNIHEYEGQTSGPGIGLQANRPSDRNAFNLINADFHLRHGARK